MQIASLFAKAGFQVDTSGLTVFRQEMALVKKEMTETLKQMSGVNKSLKGVIGRFRSIQGMFDPGKMTKWREAIGAATRQYVRTIAASQKAMDGLSLDAMMSAKRLATFHSVLNTGLNSVINYTQAIFHLEAALERLRRTNTGQPIPLPRPRVGAGQGQGGGGGSGGAGQRSTSFLEALGIGSFLKPMLPTGIGIGGMLGSGYAVKELIATGREMMAVELKMKAVSKTSADFAQNMKFTADISKEMGLDIVQATNAYANIVVSAQDKLNPQDMQKMFYGFNKYYTAVHMTMEDQRLANLAIQQMFGKDKIQAQEARLQMGQRVTPFIKLLTQAAKQELGSKFTTFDDVMKKGLLDPAKLLPKVAVLLGNIADQGDAYNEALRNSQVAQSRFTIELKEMAYAIMKGGLDKALAGLFVGLTKLLSFIKTLWRGIKTAIGLIREVFNAISEHPFITVTLVAVIGSLLAWQAGLMGVLVAAGRFLTILTPIARWIAAINVAMLRWIFLSTVLILLLSQLDGYLAGETNWLSVWQEYVELLIANVALFFEYYKGGMENALFYIDKWIAWWLRGINIVSFGLLGISEQQKAMFDLEASAFGKNPELTSPGKQQKAIFANMLAGMGIGNNTTTTSQTTVAPVVNVNFDMGNMSPQMKEALRAGDMNAFGTSVGSSISIGGLGQFVGK